MLISQRYLVLGIGLAAMLILAGLAAACGSGGKEAASQSDAAASTASALETARLHVEQMVAAAENADLPGAKAHFEAGHDPLHAVIDDLQASDPALAASLDEAVDDVEGDLEKGEEADHIVEIGNQILDLLAQVE